MAATRCKRELIIKHYSIQVIRKCINASINTWIEKLKDFISQVYFLLSFSLVHTRTHISHGGSNAPLINDGVNGAAEGSRVCFGMVHMLQAPCVPAAALCLSASPTHSAQVPLSAYTLQLCLCLRPAVLLRWITLWYQQRSGAVCLMHTECHNDFASS